MAHVIEPAATGRAKCRGCGEKIAAGEWRFGERLPNPFGEGEATHWFHLDCAAIRRPEPFLETLAGRSEPLDGAERLTATANAGVAHPRLTRINGAERAPTARAQCRFCREPIPKDAWRIPLVFYEEDRFVPAGYVHVGCAPAYFESSDILPRVRRFAPGLRDEELKAVEQELQLPPQAGGV